MQIKSFSNNANIFKALQSFAVIVQTGSPIETMQALQAIKASPLFADKTGWQSNFDKMQSVINGNIEYSIFALNGNSKLPFVSFSSLPGVTCPGAGQCLDFCYSFRAWRYPAAFMRQCQNAYMLRHNKPGIIEALHNVNASFKGQSYDVRLYVDGDFSSVNDVAFWFDLIKQYPLAKVYGYSKSFVELLAYNKAYPDNYMLNISGGHNASIATIDRVKALPITRGEFIAVSIGRKVRSVDHGTIATNKALRASFAGKAFPCPGTCGTCTGKGHACGMQALKGIPIIIAMH
jgi:hypothetical protein